MDRVTLFGAAYSVYVRIVRLVLTEIGVPYDLVEIDIFDKAHVSADYLQRHPFGRIPALSMTDSACSRPMPSSAISSTSSVATPCFRRT